MQAARAAHAAGVPFCLSTVSLCSLGEVAKAAPTGPIWFQLYVIRDRGFMRDLLATAKAAGCEGAGVHRRHAGAGRALPRSRIRACRGRARRCAGCCRRCGGPAGRGTSGLHGRPHQLGNLAPVLGKASGLNDYIGWLGNNFDPSIAWKDLEWIRDGWDGPLIIKGILDPDDAREAAAIGADGIVVSNHGGRQLDGVLSTARGAAGDRGGGGDS